MTATEILDHLARAGVRLFLQQGRLRFRAEPGAYDQSLRELVAAQRESLVDCLQAEQDRFAEEFGRICKQLERLQSLSPGQPGRATVLEVWRTLARRWLDEGNCKLLELHAYLADLQVRWQEQDRQHRSLAPRPWLAFMSSPKSRKKFAQRVHGPGNS